MSDTTTLIRMVRGNRLTIGEAEALLAAVVCVTPAVGADRPALWCAHRKLTAAIEWTRAHHAGRAAQAERRVVRRHPLPR